MDRHFAALQKTLKADPALKDVQLVTRQLRSGRPTRRPVLKKHAKTPERRPDALDVPDRRPRRVDQFAARFGVSVARALNDARDITHNLRTAIIDADGKLVKVYTGNDWSPEQVLADLKTAWRELTQGVDGIRTDDSSVHAARAAADRAAADAARRPARTSTRCPTTRSRAAAPRCAASAASSAQGARIASRRRCSPRSCSSARLPAAASSASSRSTSSTT